MSRDRQRLEAEIWPTRRDAYLAAGYPRTLAIELAWMNVEDPKRLETGLPVREQPIFSVTADQVQPLTQYCETHESSDCLPSECPDVRLYHRVARKQTEKVCQAPGCSKRFVSNRKDAKYHSQACRKYASRRPLLV